MTTKSEKPASERDSMNNRAEASIRAALEAFNEHSDTRSVVEWGEAWQAYEEVVTPSAITALLAELDAMRAGKQEQALQYLTDQGQWIEETGKLIAERDAALTRAREAEADSARLDWLLFALPMRMIFEIGLTADSRDAIDAARTPANEKD